MADHSPRTAPKPSEAMRSCIRTGCRWPSAATLSYRYVTAEVWLSDLGEEHPSTHDLCPHHADNLRVPRGWTLVDDRRPVEAVHEPSAAELVQRVTQLRSTVDAILEQPINPTRSRYADLLDNLPRYDPADDDEPVGEDHHDASAPAPELVPVGVSHELAPIVRQLATVRRVSAGAHRHPNPHTEGAAPGSDSGHDQGDEVDLSDGHPAAGKARPDPDAVHETGLRGAIVVQLPLRVEETEDA